MLGAIAGDVIGSVFEFNPTKREDFELFCNGSDFTDDSVLTVAVAAAILDGHDYGRAIQDFARRYPGRGYGGMFAQWIHDENPAPYNSFGNGSAMRVSAVGFAFDNEEAVLREARRTAECTHNHAEGIKGAQATALAILLARQGASKDEIRQAIAHRFGYDLGRSLESIRPGYRFNEICQETVPEAIVAFLESDNYEDCIRKAVSLGGDADTLACIAGGIAEAFYGGVPSDIAAQVRQRLDSELVEITDRFYATYVSK